MDISSLLEIEVKEGKPSELHANGEIAAYKNIPDFSIRDIASVRFRKLHCTGCDIHIGSAPSQAHNMHEHPVLHVLLCTNCRNFYGDGTFEQGDDATDMFCRWCANGGNLYCCSYCSNTFCYACIKRNFDPLVRKKIERDEKWKCFVCNPADLYTARAACWALLQHVQTVTRILQTERKMSPEEIEAKMNLDESQCCPHKRKRSNTPSDDEEEDETYTIPKRKRRRVSNTRRAKRRTIKLENTDGGSEGSTTEQGPRQPNSNRVSNNDNNADDDDDNNNDDEPNFGNDQSPEDMPLSSRKKNRRLRSVSSNRSTDTDRYAQDDEIPPPLLQCDQTMIEGAESLSFESTSPGGGGGGGGNRIPSSAIPKQAGITPVPTVNLLKRTVTGLATRGGREHRIIRSVTGAPLLVRKLPHLLPNPSQSGNNVKTTGLQPMPMVSIPSRNHVNQTPTNRINVIQPAALVRNSTTGGYLKQIRPHIVLAQPIPNPNIATVNRNPTIEPPSVINLDSDDDEQVTKIDGETTNEPKTTQQSNDRVPELSTTTYPVRPDDGLMTVLSSSSTTTTTMTTLTKNSTNDVSAIVVDDDETITEPTSKRSIKTFERAISGSTQSIDKVLDSLKTKLKRVLETATTIMSPNKELIAAKAKTKSINRTIKRTVSELTSLSDNVISAYRNYKREFAKDNAANNHTPLITLNKNDKSNKIISLDMECTRESEPDDDVHEYDQQQQQSDDDSDNCQDIRPMREIRPYRWRVNRAVDARPVTEDKSVQAYDVVTADYEKSIGYALLLKADYDAKRGRDILIPVMVPDENFGKYEDEFIDYLQYIEDRRNKDDDDDDDDSTFTSVNDLVEADMTISRGQTENNEPVDSNKQTNNDENVEILDEHLEISVSTDSINSTSSGRPVDSAPNSKMETETEMADEHLNDETKESAMPEVVEAAGIVVNETPSDGRTSSSKVRCRGNDEETVLAVRALVNEDGDDVNVDGATNSCQQIESDDECTVLD